MANADASRSKYTGQFWQLRNCLCSSRVFRLLLENAVVALPILKGGLTAGNSVATSGAVILRRVTISEPKCKLVYWKRHGIFTSDDGNTSNIVANAVTLSSLTGTGTLPRHSADHQVAMRLFQASTSQALFVNVGTAVAGTVDIRVYGDTVNF